MTAELNLTDALLAWRSGADKDARAQLDREIYAALKRIAAARWCGGGSPATYSPTALVHEAVARLLDGAVDWRSRSHFFALAALQMRSVLVDHARRRSSEKHGGGAVAVSLREAHVGVDTDTDFLDLDAAIHALAAVEPRAARVVELTYFGGLTANDCAEVLGVGVTTIENDLAYSRAWLKRRLAA
jgi:RNA polymerase sigma factor (TIGR02999 family)